MLDSVQEQRNAAVKHRHPEQQLERHAASTPSKSRPILIQRAEVEPGRNRDWLPDDDAVRRVVQFVPRLQFDVPFFCCRTCLLSTQLAAWYRPLQDGGMVGGYGGISVNLVFSLPFNLVWVWG